MRSRGGEPESWREAAEKPAAPKKGARKMVRPYEPDEKALRKEREKKFDELQAEVSSLIDNAMKKKP
jgi:DnaJ-class molecular chaperone